MRSLGMMSRQKHSFPDRCDAASERFVDGHGFHLGFDRPKRQSAPPTGGGSSDYELCFGRVSTLGERVRIHFSHFASTVPKTFLSPAAPQHIPKISPFSNLFRISDFGFRISPFPPPRK
jgi:hypothetical protein